MVICSNCGFQNQSGDEFCGNCGRYLEFSGASDADSGSAQQATDGHGTTGEPRGSDSPTVVVPAAGGAAAGAGAAGGAAGGTGPGGTGGTGPTVDSGPALGGRGPDVICWNCGRRNPSGRAFCMQCGTKLTVDSGAPAGVGAAASAGPGAAAGAGAGAAAGAGPAAGAGYGPATGYGSGVSYGGPPTRSYGSTPSSGGGGSRILAVAVGVLALLVLVAIGAFAFGLFSGPPGSSGPVAVISPSPSAGAGASDAATSSPLGSFPVASATFAVPTLAPPTTGVVTFPPATESPVPSRTRRPPCDATGQPPGCRPTRRPATPTPEPTPTPTPTPEPTPVNCMASTAADRSQTLTVEHPARTIPEGFAWCVHDVTFTNTSLAGSTGSLKLYLENPEFIGPPGNYGMARIGWPGAAGSACEANIASDFATSPEYHPMCEEPFGYDHIPPGTIVSFEISCTSGTCGGLVTIEFERIPVPIDGP